MEKILLVQPILQNDYGQSRDCVITSMLMMISYFTKYDRKYLYSVIESNAKKHGYTGVDKGVQLVYIHTIFKDTIKQLGISNIKSTYYATKVLYSFNTIKNSINNNCPMVLTFIGDKVYGDHAVTIIGYKEDGKILYVYDNWTTNVTKIEYSKVKTLSTLLCYKIN